VLIETTGYRAEIYTIVFAMNRGIYYWVFLKYLSSLKREKSTTYDCFDVM